MPSFDPAALRKGSKAIDDALSARNRGDGDYRPFLPNIYWKDDKDSRYLLFLNPLEEIPQVEFHPYVDCGDNIPHMCIARTDASIGDTTDPLREQFGYKPRLTDLAIAVELEPTMEVVHGRTRPVGFEVKTVTFERRLRGDDGELSEEREEVTAPVVGLVAQSPYNFFNQLKAYDESEAAIHTTPVKVTRLGKKDNVTYAISGYDAIEPDLTNLLEYIDNLSYIADADVDDLLAEIDTDDTETATVAIGQYLLYRRIEELADADQYEEILSKAKPAKYPDKKEERPERPSQRRNQESQAEPKRSQRVSKESPAAERIEELRAKNRKAKAAA